MEGIEGLFVVIIVVWAITVSLTRKKNFVKRQGQTGAGSGAPASPAGRGRETGGQPAPAAAARAKAAARQSAPKQDLSAGSLGNYKPMESSEGMSGYQVITHRLDTSGRRQEYTGSLGGGSTEGEDVCDPSLGHGDEEPDGFVFEDSAGADVRARFNRDTLLQGVVMNEILTRPAQRKWGRR